MHKGENELAQASMQMLIRVIVGAVIALAISILVLMLASAGISMGKIKETLMGQITVASCVIGAFAGGVLTTKPGSGKQLLHGILVGVFLFVLMLLIGTAMYGVTELNKGAVTLIAACLCGGALSGLIFRKSKSKGKRTGEGRRKRKKR